MRFRIHGFIDLPRFLADHQDRAEPTETKIHAGYIARRAASEIGPNLGTVEGVETTYVKGKAKRETEQPEEQILPGRQIGGDSRL